MFVFGGTNQVHLFAARSCGLVVVMVLWFGDYLTIEPLQDKFSAQNIRSVELQFIDRHPSSENILGYGRFAGGYRRASAVYFEALKFVHQYLRQGFLNHFGGSNGAVVAPYALAYYGADAYLNRVLFHAGPFFPAGVKPVVQIILQVLISLLCKNQNFFNYLSSWFLVFSA